MIDVSLESTPNQIVRLTVEGASYAVTLRDAGELMLCDIERDGELIILGHRMQAMAPIIPYRYQYSGNFIMITEDGEYPHWTKFNVSQSMVYATQAEIEDARQN